jgi:hypothetical protein
MKWYHARWQVVFVSVGVLELGLAILYVYLDQPWLVLLLGLNAGVCFGMSLFVGLVATYRKRWLESVKVNVKLRLALKEAVVVEIFGRDAMPVVGPHLVPENYPPEFDD